MIAFARHASRFGILALGLAASSCTTEAGTSAPKHAPLRLSRTTANTLRSALNRLPDITVEVASQGGSSITSLLEVRNRKTDISAPLADVAYLAYGGQLEEMGQPFDELRGMAVISLNTLHLLVGRDTRVQSLRELTGLRVSFGAPSSSTSLITPRLFRTHGIAPETIRGASIPNAQMFTQLLEGRLDAAFSGFVVPNASVTAAMKQGISLRPVDGPQVEELRTRYPHLKRTLIPRNTYPNQPEPIRTVAVDVLLVCRADLSEDLVYSLLDAYFATRPATTPPNLERAPATPIPLHPGATRFYRQRELSR
jgi:TRAP transporter TAXI family solute receptor